MERDLFFGVYFIGCQALRTVKIGFTAHDPSRRLRQLQTSAPALLEPLGVIRGPMTLEDVIHEHFRSHRRQGEWFSRSGLLETFILHGIDPWPPRENDPNIPRGMPSAIAQLRSSIEVEANRRDEHQSYLQDPGWRLAFVRGPEIRRHLKPPKTPNDAT